MFVIFWRCLELRIQPLPSVLVEFSSKFTRMLFETIFLQVKIKLNYIDQNLDSYYKQLVFRFKNFYTEVTHQLLTKVNLGDSETLIKVLLGDSWEFKLKQNTRKRALMFP